METRISTQVDGVTVSLSNLDKPLFSDGFTKGELISYYVEVAEVMLPHLAGRAVTRVRFPSGTAAQSFYEKNAPAGTPDWVATMAVATSAGQVSYVLARDRATLVWLANLAAVELHTPQWRIEHATIGDFGVILDGAEEPRSTTLLIDLDPGPGVTPEDSAKAAIVTATSLAELGLVAYPKTSGNKGLQLSVPIAPTPASEVFGFAQALARSLAARHPRQFVATMAKQARAGLVFLDYAQNLAARNTVTAYSVRGLASPSVATPLSWDEVAALRPDSVLRVSPAEALRRVGTMGDLWEAQIPTVDSPELPDPPA